MELLDVWAGTAALRLRFDALAAALAAHHARAAETTDVTEVCLLHPSPFTLHPSPFTLHPSPFTLHPNHWSIWSTNP